MPEDYTLAKQFFDKVHTDLWLELSKFFDNKNLIMAIENFEKLLQNNKHFEYGSAIEKIISELPESSQEMFFVHLHNHSDYSALDGAWQLKKSMKSLAKKFRSLSLTDHGVMIGILNFNKLCLEQGLKGLIGVEAYEAKDVKIKNANDRYNHLTMIAKNRTGLKALYRMVTFSYKRENFYYKPRIDINWFKENKEALKGNVVVMSGCLNGKLPELLLNGQHDLAVKCLEEYKEIFGEEDFYIELQNHGIVDELRVLPLLFNLAKETKTKVVATNDVHYPEKGDAKSQEILLSLQYQTTLRERIENNQMFPEEFYFKSYQEMYSLFKGYSGCVGNTLEIASKCENMNLEEKEYHLPKFPLPEGYTEDEYMKKLALEGIDKKFPTNVYSSEYREKVRERVEMESETITQMGFPSYMLIVQDFANFSAQNDILVGPGRGSACGCEVANCLGITKVDPMPYDLVFERFLNPERISMPDIDVDFAYDKRYKVINYSVERYHKVAQILTLGKMMARMAIRDTGRVMELPLAFVDKIAKAIPMTIGMTISKALEENSEFKKLYETEPNAKELIDNAKSIEGLIRQTGIHAAGVVLGDDDLDNYAPLMETEDSNIPVIMVDMSDVEFLKLLKMDFLGLRTLTVLKDACKLIKQTKGIDVNIDDIPFDDKNVYSYISTGDTHGVFQLESGGMQKFMGELQPQTFEDIIAGISIYRPGPMDNIPVFIENKKNPAKIKYPKDAEHLLKPILDVTYGIMVYQEQVMRIVRDLAGYSMGRSDLVRRGMAKKKVKILEAEREIFIYGEMECPNCHGKGKTPEGKCEHCDGKGFVVAKNSTPNDRITVKGCLRNNISIETANEIYDDMIDFASYAFNKSHAAGYAVIGVQTAWLKYYYPVEYMTAYLNSILGDSEKVKKYVSVCKKMGIEIVRPSINKSQMDFSIDNGKIIFGLSAIKNVGESINEVIKEREMNGIFNDIQDILERTNINKREIESLAKAGALDDFGLTRSQILSFAKKIIDGCKKEKDIKSTGQLSLFDVCDSISEYRKISIPEMNEYPKIKLYEMEKEVTGFYMTGHPLNLPQYLPFVKKANISLDEDFTESDNKRKVRMIGIISFDRKKDMRYTRQDKSPFASFRIEDRYGDIDCILFPKQYQDYGYLLEESIVEVQGYLKIEKRIIESKDDDGNDELKEFIHIQLVAEKISLPVSQKFKKLYIQIPIDLQVSFKEIENLIPKDNGIDEVYLFDEATNKGFRYKYKTLVSESLEHKLCKIVGSQNVISS